MSFSQWFKENLGEYANDIASSGANVGFPHITYTSDCIETHDMFEKEIWNHIVDDALEMGYDSPDAFVATFNQQDMLWDSDSRKTLFLWYVCETHARKMTDCPIDSTNCASVESGEQS